MSELQQVGALDPGAQARLLSDLQQTDPALWPLMVRQFRAALAYRRHSDSPGPSGAAAVQGQGVRPQAGPLPGRTSLPSPAGQPAHTAGPLAGQPQPPSAACGGSLGGANGVEQASYQQQPYRQPSYQQQVADQTGGAGATLAGAPPAPGPSQSTAAFALAPAAASSPAHDNLHQGRPGGVQADVARLPNDTVRPATAGRQPAGRSERSGYAQDWRALTSAILALETDLHGSSDQTQDLADQARLRLLYLAAGQRDSALRPISGAKPAVQDFWIKQLYGLGTWLDAQREPDESQRAGQAKQNLAEALSRLGELAPLVVRNLAFCTEIQSFGCTTPFKSYEFTPGQLVLLYAEVDNFTSEPTPKGYHTSLRSRYRIFDAQGRCVEDQDFTVTEEYCRNRRRDFFIGYHLGLPERLAPGRYTLELTIEDLKGQKVGQSSIEFDIIDSGD